MPRTMHASLAVILALAAPALATAAPAPAQRDRLGYEREIDSSRYNQVPKQLDYVLNEEYLAAQKNRAKLVTRPRPAEPVAAEDVLLESNVVQILRPSALGRRGALVRRRRGYNLEHVNVPQRYPYLAVPSYYRVRRWPARYRRAAPQMSRLP